VWISGNAQVGVAIVSNFDHKRLVNNVRGQSDCTALTSWRETMRHHGRNNVFSAKKERAPLPLPLCTESVCAEDASEKLTVRGMPFTERVDRSPKWKQGIPANFLLDRFGPQP
jgi:hypothetical protein